MSVQTADLRIKEIHAFATPEEVLSELPISDAAATATVEGREAIHKVLHGEDDRLVVVVGPCSIHDPKAAMEYAQRLVKLREQYAEDLIVVMRVYFEKPRTTVGWKGLINDPDLDDSFDINKGIRLARQLLLEVNELGLPTGTEFLDLITPQYVGDLVAWGAIGARTTESQGHRELSSGLSCPVGFKNGTGGNVKIAVDAIGSASRPHRFLSITKEGQAAIVATTGNEDCHVILRGGKEPNFDAVSVAQACEVLQGADIRPRVMIDFSHGNSLKKFENQPKVCSDVATQVAAGDQRIFGVMIESNLVEGNQKVVNGKAETYGQSITDACVNWDTTELMLEELAQAVRKRRI
ncbi:MAG: 3-deoxy-7-phosphoheptulonate synthase [Gammaproteobacteria bacterium]|nr:3-deoxy-7-phosphoheptulonate synthase [Gammaproteobacteria bacterium]